MWNTCGCCVTARKSRPSSATGLWLPKDTIRWVLVDYQTDIRANEKQRYALQYGPDSKRKAGPASTIHIAQSDACFAVDTGAAVFRISKSVFSLFEEVRLADGTVLVAPPAKSNTPLRAAIKRFQANVTRRIPVAANKGAGHLIYAKNTGRKEIEDYTLRFTSDAEYRVDRRQNRPGR